MGETAFWSGRRVLVTGGAGFIGSHLVRRLTSTGVRVRVVDNLSRGRRENLQACLDAVELIEDDLTDAAASWQACRGMDIAIHLASKVGGIGYYLTRPAEVLAHNVLLDTQVWQAAQAAGVQRYLYASSGHVYPAELQQTPDSPPLSEEQAYPANPPLAYGWAKLLGERLLEYDHAQGSPLGIAILRLVGVYGPLQDTDLATGSAIPVFIRRAIEAGDGSAFTILGTGRETRSYCYIDDVVEAILLAVEKGPQGRLVGPLNVGSEGRNTIQDLARQIIAMAGKEVPIVNDLSHETAIWGQAVECSRARRELGWQPCVSLSEGLRRTYTSIAESLRGAEIG